MDGNFIYLLIFSILFD